MALRHLFWLSAFVANSHILAACQPARQPPTSTADLPIPMEDPSQSIVVYLAPSAKSDIIREIRRYAETRGYELYERESMGEVIFRVLTPTMQIIGLTEDPSFEIGVFRNREGTQASDSDLRALTDDFIAGLQNVRTVRIEKDRLPQ